MKLSLPSLWNTAPAGWTAIDLNQGVTMASVTVPRQAGQKPKVLGCAHVSEEPDSADGLSRFIQSAAAKSYPKTLLLNRGDYQLHLLEKPNVRDEELESSLRWAITSLLTYPSTNAAISWMTVPKNTAAPNRPVQIYVVSADRSVIDRELSLFKSAGAELSAVDIPEAAQRNISALIDSNTKGCCLVHATDGGVQITVTFQGELYLEHFVAELLFDPIAPGEQEAAAHEFDRVALEIQRSLDFVRRNYAYIPIDHVTLAPTPQDIELHKALSSRMVEPVRLLDLSDLFDLSACPNLESPEQQSLYFNALGASLRYLESAA